MKQFNTILQYREHEYFLSKKDEQFVFDTITPIVKVAKLITHKSSFYFDYTGMQIKSITTRSIAMSELIGVRVCHVDCTQCTGTINVHYGLDNTAYIGVMWDGGLGHLKLPATYFWTEAYKLLIL